jgi:hypothetical protein
LPLVKLVRPDEIIRAAQRQVPNRRFVRIEAHWRAVILAVILNLILKPA